MFKVKVRRLKDYPGYAVSRDGRVWTKLKRGRGRGLEHDNWIEKKQRHDVGNGGTGYMTVWLTQAKGPVCVHRLVALAFIGAIPKGYHVNHLDGDKTNNRLENLEITTCIGNLQHAWTTGLIQVAKPKLNAQQVLEIRQHAALGEKYADLASQFKIDPSGVSDIVLRKTWKHI